MMRKSRGAIRVEVAKVGGNDMVVTRIMGILGRQWQHDRIS